MRDSINTGFPYKSCFFIRKSIPLRFTTTNFREYLICGDTTSAHAVEELAILVEEVYHPLLNNRANQSFWPEELRKDVERKVQCLRDVVSEAKGNLLQRTILPTPIALDHLMEISGQILDDGRIDLIDVKLRNALESLVNRWCIQINEVIERNEVQKARPEMSARQLTPDMEIAFWQIRHENLNNIYGQLQQEKCRTASRVLERIRSVYSSAFRSTFRGLVAALEEARDITLWLKPLVEYIHKDEWMDGYFIVHDLMGCYQSVQCKWIRRGWPWRVCIWEKCLHDLNCRAHAMSLICFRQMKYSVAACLNW